MDSSRVSPVAIAIRTIIESSGLDAKSALEEVENKLPVALWFTTTFSVFPIPYHLSAAKPKPWINHGISFSGHDQAIVISCKAHRLESRVHIELVDKRILRAAPQRPPVRRTTLVPPSSIDMN